MEFPSGPEQSSAPASDNEVPVNFLRRKQIIGGVILAVILPFLSILPYGRMFGSGVSAETTFLTSRFLLWVALAGLFIYSRKVEQHPLRLWKEKAYNMGIYFAFFAATFVGIIALLIILGIIIRLGGLYEEAARVKELQSQLLANPLLAWFTCATAAVTEELFYRAYLQPRLEYLLKSRVAGIAVTALAFALVHFGFGTFINIVGPLLIGLIFGIHYSLFRNIRFLIVFHFLWDLMAVYLVRT
jgi:uncharacterized protein